MTSRNVNILKVIARYSLYFIGILGVLFLAAKLGGFYDCEYDYDGDPVNKYFFRWEKNWRKPTPDKDIWYLLKNYFKYYGKGLYTWKDEHQVYEVSFSFEPILNFIGQFGILYGISNVFLDALGLIGVKVSSHISNFAIMKSKLRHKVFKILGKDTRKSSVKSSLKKTIKKNNKKN